MGQRCRRWQCWLFSTGRGAQAHSAHLAAGSAHREAGVQVGLPGGPRWGGRRVGSKGLGEAHLLWLCGALCRWWAVAVSPWREPTPDPQAAVACPPRRAPSPSPFRWGWFPTVASGEPAYALTCPNLCPIISSLKALQLNPLTCHLLPVGTR